MQISPQGALKQMQAILCNRAFRREANNRLNQVLI
jgi:hypothetical protein